MEHHKLVTTARLTGIWYLLLAISGILGFLIFHPQIFVSDKPQETLSNLIELESTARIRMLFELFIIISQALAAVWFYKLFIEIKAWAAFAIGSWGLMNSAAIMISAISMGTAIKIASNTILTLQEKIILIQLLNNIISNAWVIGGLFFGLWLIPMGYIIVTSRCMPLWLGRILMIGGVGYILSTTLNAIGLSHYIVDSLTIPATIGEFWMIGYLILYGIKPLNNINQV